MAVVIEIERNVTFSNASSIRRGGAIFINVSSVLQATDIYSFLHLIMDGFVSGVFFSFIFFNHFINFF
jgi:hypothetical protein